MTLTAYAVRRGLEYYSTKSTLVKRDDQQDMENLLTFLKAGGAVVIITFFVFVVIANLIDYAVSQVVATLAMIETPTCAIAVAPASEDDIALETGDDQAKDGLLETGGPNITLVPQQPITAKIRGTLRHLRAHAGRASPWRGFMNNWLYQSSFIVISTNLESILPKFPGLMVVIYAITGALLAQIHVAWTHKVIAMPQKTRFWQRFVSFADWKALALPAALKSAATSLSILIILAFAVVFRLDKVGAPEATTAGQTACTILKFLTLVAIIFACGLFLWLPAQVTYIRMESSLLPDNQDTIVPFDRTFEGKVTPKIHGGSGCIGFVDAWKSFQWEARRRVVKVYCKAAGLSVALGFLFAHVMLFEVWAFMGTAFIAQMKKQQEQAGLQ